MVLYLKKIFICFHTLTFNNGELLHSIISDRCNLTDVITPNLLKHSLYKLQRTGGHKY